jgi:uncharacterized protein (TIGR04222 family)
VPAVVIALTAVVFGAAALVFGALGLAWWLRDRADRAAAASLTSMRIHPYHAAATAGSRVDMDEAAAAVLLRSGRIEIDEAGLLSAVPGRPPPAHPVEAALMDALHQREQPSALRQLRASTWTDDRNSAFLREQDARAPRWAKRNDDNLIVVAMMAALVLGLACPAPFLLLRDDHPEGFAFSVAGVGCLGLMIGVPAAYAVLLYWPIRRDHFRRHCMELPPHPALQALDSEQRRRLRASVHYRDPDEPHEEPPGEGARDRQVPVSPTDEGE